MGLLSFTFHPNFQENGYLFTLYNFSIEEMNYTRLSRFTASSPNHNSVDLSTEVVLLEVLQPFTNHDGGQIAFGPDGYLYIGLGDGGNGGDPYNNAQNLKTLLGTILRLDVDNSSDSLNYSIPSTNPFVADTNARPEIWAWGLRSPWRFSFDTETGTLWAGDVGQERYEEIDIIEGGKNYGWRIMESWYCFAPETDCDSSTLTSPVWGYDRSGGKSVTGGHVYHGSKVPQLQNRYVYADFVFGNIWALDYVSDNDVTNELLFDTDHFIVTFGVDENRELYFADYFSGRIYNFVEVPATVDGNKEMKGIKLNLPTPNPPHSTVDISYELPSRTEIRLALFNVLGKEIRFLAEGKQEPGVHHINLNTLDIPSGIYYVQLNTSEGHLSQKMTILH